MVFVNLGVSIKINLFLYKVYSCIKIFIWHDTISVSETNVSADTSVIPAASPKTLRLVVKLSPALAW